MAKFLVRTEQDNFTIEAVSYVIDSQGLKLMAEGGAIVASFPTYQSMVNVNALVAAAPSNAVDEPATNS
jgi:hypothetical protein